MKFEDIARYRLANQHLAAPRFTKPEQVASWLLAVQAQDYWGGKWGIGIRMPRVTEAILERAVAQARIVRTWPMRGTIHFLAAKDIRWMVALLAPRVNGRISSYFVKLGITEAIIDRSRALLLKALKGKQLSRAEMYAILEKAGIDTTQMRGLFLTGRLAHEGLICFAAHRGKQATFARVEDWVPKGRALTGDAALGEVVLRYFVSHGPATMHDLSWWSGMTQKEIKQGLAVAGAKLRSEVIEGKTYWMSSKLPKIRKNTGKFYLLPTYDEFFIAYKDRGASLAAGHAQQVGEVKNGMFGSVIIDGTGQSVGLWWRTLLKGGISFKFRLFRKLVAGEQVQLDAAADRYAKFLGLKRV